MTRAAIAFFCAGTLSLYPAAVFGQAAATGAQPPIVRSLDSAPVIRARGAAAAPGRVASPVALAEGKKWRFTHPGATILGGLDLKKLREQAPPAAWRQLRDVVPLPGSQLVQAFLSDIDAVYISLDGARKAAQPLVLLAGRFQNAELRKTLGIPETAAGATAILLGEAASVSAAKRRLRAPGGAKEPILDEAIRLAEANDLWIAGDARAPLTLSAGANAAAGLMRGVRAFALGVTLRQRVTLRLQVATQTAADAVNLMSLYEAARLKARSTIEGREAWDEIARNPRVEKLDTGLSFELEIDPATIPADTARRLAAQLPAAASPLRPVRRTVVIQGMEEGPPAIPIGQPR